jgi:hypothetical protein
VQIRFVSREFLIKKFLDARRRTLDIGGNAASPLSSSFAARGSFRGVPSVPHSVIEAIKQGLWDYEPEPECREDKFDSTEALPGTNEKLVVLANRAEQGLPLWHPSDRLTYARDD